MLALINAAEMQGKIHHMQVHYSWLAAHLSHEPAFFLDLRFVSSFGVDMSRISPLYRTVKA